MEAADTQNDGNYEWTRDLRQRNLMLVNNSVTN